MADKQVSVNRQWDVSSTAFTTFDRLRSLISIASQDNVQPQAILAAEALGAFTITSPSAISSAITTLGGNESVRLTQFKLHIGLSSSGVIRTIRESTALLQFFIVATSCKLCYTVEEIGDIMFYMIKNLLSSVDILSRRVNWHNSLKHSRATPKNRYL